MKLSGHLSGLHQRVHIPVDSRRNILIDAIFSGLSGLWFRVKHASATMLHNESH